MSSDLTRVPIRDVATTDDNIGLGLGKENETDHLDLYKDLDAREEELLRDWAVRIVKDLGVYDASDGYQVGELDGTDEACIKGIVGRWSPRFTRYRRCDHFDEAALNAFWTITSGAPVVSSNVEGGVCTFKMNGANPETIKTSSRFLPQNGPMEIAVLCKMTGRANDDNSNATFSLLDSANTGVWITWDGTVGNNKWRVSRVQAGVEAEGADLTGAASPDSSYIEVRVGVRITSDAKWQPYATVIAAGGGSSVTVSLTAVSCPLGGPASGFLSTDNVALALDLVVDAALLGATFE